MAVPALVVDRLERDLPFEFIKLHYEPDGYISERRAESDAGGKPRCNRRCRARASCADIGIAWDGDFDRCFFFDENGRFIEGYYVVGLLADSMLRGEKGARIVYDPRLTWSTEDIIASHGGVAVQSKSGHSFMKEVMRREDAIYGGEMSAHHYFRDFFYCDTGMVPWLLVAALMSAHDKPLSELVDERMRLFPASGEINRHVDDVGETIARVRTIYEDKAERVDTTDGISLDFGNWRFNLRASNTEPVIRLNVESRGDEGLMRRKTEELLAAIGGSL